MFRKAVCGNSREDVEMPGMDWLELPKEIRKNDAKTLCMFHARYRYVLDFEKKGRQAMLHTVAENYTAGMAHLKFIKENEVPLNNEERFFILIYSHSQKVCHNE